MSNVKIWEYEGDYYIQGEGEFPLCMNTKEAAEELAALRAQVEALEAKNERMEDGLQNIENWCNAYPIEVFPEPDFKAVRELFTGSGITLDSVAASNMRHVIKGVEKIVTEALK